MYALLHGDASSPFCSHRFLRLDFGEAGETIQAMPHSKPEHVGDDASLGCWLVPFEMQASKCPQQHGVQYTYCMHTYWR